MTTINESYEVPIVEKESDELFLDLIKERPCLYNKNLKEYHDNILRENAMEEIAFIMQDTVANCENKWQRFKANYLKEQPLQELESRSGGVSTRKKWIHFPKMKDIFALQNHSRCSYSNLSPSIGSKENVKQPTIPVRLSRKRKLMNPVESAMNKIHSTISTVIQSASEEKCGTSVAEDDDIDILTGKMIAARLNQLSPTKAKKKGNLL